MVFAMTDQDIADLHRKNWDRLEAGSHFDNAAGRHFLVVSKTDAALEVIALDPENIGKILAGQPCRRQTFGYKDVWVANVHEQPAAADWWSNLTLPKGSAPLPPIRRQRDERDQPQDGAQG